jgi:hypothetical protein
MTASSFANFGVIYFTHLSEQSLTLCVQLCLSQKLLYALMAIIVVPSMGLGLILLITLSSVGYAVLFKDGVQSMWSDISLC